MKKFDLVYVMAGEGTRYSPTFRKSWETVNNSPIFSFALDVFLSHPALNKAIVVMHPSETKKSKLFWKKIITL